MLLSVLNSQSISDKVTSEMGVTGGEGGTDTMLFVLKSDIG